LFDCASDSARPSSESVGETKQAFSVSDIEKYLPPEIRDIIDFAGGVIGTFTLISTVVSVVTKVLTFAHILRADPDANAQRFAALTQHLDAIAGSLSWQISEMAREQRLADETAAVISAGEILESTGGPVDINSPTALQSLTALTESEEPSAFQRLFNDAVTNGDGVWKNNQRDRPEIVNGLVYDWRVGVPALLMLTSMRLNVLGAIDPNFANNRRFTDELMGHRGVLKDHYQKMWDGVRCALTHNFNVDHTLIRVVSCADIYTGLSGHASFTSNWPEDSIQASLNDLNASNVMDDIQRSIRYQMPFFAMQRMIDQL